MINQTISILGRYCTNLIYSAQQFSVCYVFINSQLSLYATQKKALVNFISFVKC